MTERSINVVRVQTPSRTVTLSWGAREGLVLLLLSAYPTTHPVVDRFRAAGVSRPIELFDANDRTFVLAVLDAWATEVGEDKLPPDIGELRSALREDAG